MHALRQLMPRLATLAAHAAIRRPSTPSLTNYCQPISALAPKLHDEKEPEEIEKVRDRERAGQKQPGRITPGVLRGGFLVLSDPRAIGEE
jgi:hypothetical protein